MSLSLFRHHVNVSIEISVVIYTFPVIVVDVFQHGTSPIGGYFHIVNSSECCYHILVWKYSYLYRKEVIVTFESYVDAIIVGVVIYFQFIEAAFDECHYF